MLFGQNLDKYPVYKDDNGYLYMYDPDSGKMWELRGGDYAGEVGKPMPGYIKGKGNMTLLGLFHIGD